MKLGLVFLVAPLLLVACAHKASPPKTPALASSTSCEKVYGRMLYISMRNNLDPDGNYSKSEQEAAVTLLDSEYRERGTTQKFYAYCTNKLSEDQASCMMDATGLEGMALCEKLYRERALKN